MSLNIKMYLLIYIIYINCVQAFSNYTFYEVTAFSANERQLLQNMEETKEYVFFLNGVTNEASTTMDVVVDSCCIENFENTLLKYDVDFSHDTEYDPHSQDDNSTQMSHKNVAETFLDWDDILQWVDSKTKQNSALTKTVIAKTYEHRDVFVLKLSIGTGKKMSVFIVTGEEGRDWLPSALLLNYINKLLSSSSSESLLNHFDFYFVPILNPDGFVYAKTEDRMWAKNRKLINPTQTCGQEKPAVGVNIDRNWFADLYDVKNPCNAIYSGSRELSEEETQGLSYILNSIALKLLAFINIRGFANLITLPHINNEVSINHNIVVEIMKHTSAVMKIHYNKSYPVGTIDNYFYNFDGNMPEWVKSKLNIPIVFTLYMQHNHFLPEESHILPLTDQLDSLLNISLVISKEIYGSLYNMQKKKCSSLILIMISFLCAFVVKFL